MQKSFATTLRSLFQAWPYTLVLILSMLVLPAQPAAAEGSRTLFPDGQPADASRANLEWYTSINGIDNHYGSNNVGFKLLRRTLLKVYAEQGEYILMGSSAMDVSGGQGDILVYSTLPDNTVGAEVVPDKSAAQFSCLTQRQNLNDKTLGQINSRAQELAGPDTIADVATGARGNAVPKSYVPCFYQADHTGIYSIVMYGPSGTSTGANAPTGHLNDPRNFDASQGATVAVWDVTVRSDSTSTKDITGRLFTYYLSLFTNGNGRPIYSTIYMVTLDGFQYKLDLNAMDPNGFIIYGNLRGFLDTDDNLLYHDVLAEQTTTGTNGIVRNTTPTERNELRFIQGNVRLAPPQYPLFFNKPDPAALVALKLPTTAQVPLITTFSFKGTFSGTTTISPTEGGKFTVTSSITSVFDLVLSRDGADFRPDNPLNRVFRKVVSTTTPTTVPWDGNDNSGKPFPASSTTIYTARMSLHGGELHFPFLDVENSTKGSPMITMINPPIANCTPLLYGCSGAFYDDRTYTTTNGIRVGDPSGSLCEKQANNQPKLLYSDPIMGFNTMPTVNGIPQQNQRAFGFPKDGNPPDSTCSEINGFGDKKGLDLWTYYPGDKASLRLTIQNPLAIDLTSFTAAVQQSGITVNWQTSAEINTLGFRLYRSSTGNRADAVLVTPQIILATGRGQGGASYTWQDTSAPPGYRYSYWLQEVETGGGTNEYGPAAAVLGGPASRVSIYLPLLHY